MRTALNFYFWCSRNLSFCTRNSDEITKGSQQLTEILLFMERQGGMPAYVVLRVFGEYTILKFSDPDRPFKWDAQGTDMVIVYACVYSYVDLDVYKLERKLY